MKLIFFRMVVLVSSLVLVVGIAEFLLSLQPRKFERISSTSNYAQFNVEYGIEPKPNLNYEELPGVRAFTNSVATFGPEIKSDVPIILHLGDSYTAGPGINYEENYPFRLQQRINQEFQKNFQSVILGMGGSSPFQQEIIFRKKLPELRPQIVVYELYANDIRDDFVYVYSNYFAKAQLYEQFPKLLFNTALGERLYIFISDLMTQKNDKKYNQLIDLPKNDPQYIWNMYTQPSLDKIKAEAEKRGAQFILFNIPLGWEFDNEYEPKAGEPRGPLATYAKEWSEKNQVPFVDMYDTFVASNTAQLNEIYLDVDHGYHLTPKGTGLVTEKLFELIKTNEVVK